MGEFFDYLRLHKSLNGIRSQFHDWPRFLQSFRYKVNWDRARRLFAQNRGGNQSIPCRCNIETF